MSPVILLAPGAGAPSGSAWMTSWAARLATIGPVVRFDYPYQVAGKKFPDRHDKLVAAHREALRSVREQHPDRPVVLAGKSMGGRMGCHVSREEPVEALVCFGYPLISASGKVRDEVLVDLTTRVLFVQGTRDPMCPLDHLAQVRARMQAPSELVVVEGGDHSLEVGASGDQDRHDRVVLAAVHRFLEKDS